MEKSKWYYRPLFLTMRWLSILVRHLTSWYSSLVWGFCIPYFVGGEGVLFSIGFALIASYAGYKIWKEYNFESDS